MKLEHSEHSKQIIRQLLDAQKATYNISHIDYTKYKFSAAKLDNNNENNPPKYFDFIRLLANFLRVRLPLYFRKFIF